MFSPPTTPHLTPPLPAHLPATSRRVLFMASSASSPQAEAPRKAVRVVVRGRVQGVGFRDWTVETAEALGLAGWVRNRRDGSVEAVFSGDPAAVDDMVSRRCPVGPPAAAVTAVVPSPADPLDPSEGFDCKPTV